MTPTREQLELAAKALGYTGFRESSEVWSYRVDQIGGYWDPANDQADNDCMACDLEIDVQYLTGRVTAERWPKTAQQVVPHDNTIESRRAAVRWARFLVAAEIGRTK